MNQIKFFAAVQFSEWGISCPSGGKRKEIRKQFTYLLWKGEHHGDNKTPIRNEAETYKTGP